jgi:pSer/pThr/pTyr-binding forkhead associated (FHA) protein
MWLTIVAGEERGRTVRVAGPDFVLGRDADCQLVLADARVSRHHARFEVAADGRVTLRNLASRNGTWVDGRRIEDAVALVGGEEIAVGRTRLRASARAPDAGEAGQSETVMGVPVGPVGGGMRQSAVQRIVVAALQEEVRGFREWTRKAIVMRALAGACGSALVAILWRIFA